MIACLAWTGDDDGETCDNSIIRLARHFSLSVSMVATVTGWAESTCQKH